jgi:hypothetical protein
MKTRIGVLLVFFAFLVFLSLSFQKDSIGQWSYCNPYVWGIKNHQPNDSGHIWIRMRIEQDNNDGTTPIKLVDTSAYLHQYPFCFFCCSPDSGYKSFWTADGAGSDNVTFNITCSFRWYDCITNMLYYSSAPMTACYQIGMYNATNDTAKGLILYQYRDKPFINTSSTRTGADTIVINNFSYYPWPMVPNKRYFYKMSYAAGFYPSTDNGDNFSNYRKSISEVNTNLIKTPSTYSLSQNYPNPFNPVTNIKFSLPKEGLVTLLIYDALGKEVATIVNEYKTAGTYNVDFDASSLSSGIYFCKLKSGDFSSVMKMVLIK